MSPPTVEAHASIHNRAVQTTTAGQYFLLAMALFPEVQKRGQAELDRVVGPDRLPDFEDIKSMPYIRALTMETMRWLPVFPSAIPHAAVADDEYMSYRIPKGTIVIPVSYFICSCMSLILIYVTRRAERLVRAVPLTRTHYPPQF